MITKTALLSTLLWAVSLTSSVQGIASESKTIDVMRVNTDISSKGIGEKIGTINFQDSDQGLVIETHLKGLTPGEHGFHIHENPSCDAKEIDGKWAAGMAAGGHLDPVNSHKHLGPNGHGHLGDLPVLIVNSHDEANEKIIVPKLKLSDIQGRSIMIHEGGDNYSDAPKPLGGGGARIACGVIQ